jgi:glyoxylase-like metal-dependent hydrolase (beta-lactamase superfamily II)
VIIEQLPLGPLQTNCFIIGCEDTKEAAVIDPGDEGDKILMTLAKKALTVKMIINTHGHFDHVGANRRLKEVTGAALVIHREDTSMLNQSSASASAWGIRAEDSPAPDKEVEEGDRLDFGKISLSVIHTPGHTRGGISIYGHGSVFVGDTLFAGSIGRTDFPGGDFDTLIRSIQQKLFVLPDDTKVYPGHMGLTTIGAEKRNNPFCRANFKTIEKR